MAARGGQRWSGGHKPPQNSVGWAYPRIGGGDLVQLIVGPVRDYCPLSCSPSLSRSLRSPIRTTLAGILAWDKPGASLIVPRPSWGVRSISSHRHIHDRLRIRIFSKWVGISPLRKPCLFLPPTTFKRIITEQII